MATSHEGSYFTWLYAMVCDVHATRPSEKYVTFLSILHGIEYHHYVLGDDSRADDGLDLRVEYLNTHFLPRTTRLVQSGCTVLEMLVAFSRRASFVADETPQYWFWIMMNNLRLLDVSDIGSDLIYVQSSIDTFINRTYDRNGNGGLFPLRYTQNDQRGVEVWYQFNEYLAENDK